MTSIKRVLTNYAERHLNTANRILHVIGVPLTFVVSTVFLIKADWPIALGCFVAGYALQFIGHKIEGNDAGEVILLKKLLGKPSIEFGTRHPSRQVG